MQRGEGAEPTTPVRHATRADTGGHGRTRADTGGHGRTRADTGGHGRTRADTGGHGRTRADTGGHGLVGPLAKNEDKTRVPDARANRVHQHAPGTYHGARRPFRRFENLDVIRAMNARQRTDSLFAFLLFPPGSRTAPPPVARCAGQESSWSLYRLLDLLDLLDRGRVTRRQKDVERTGSQTRQTLPTRRSATSQFQEHRGRALESYNTTRWGCG